MHRKYSVHTRTRNAFTRHGRGHFQGCLVSALETGMHVSFGKYIEQRVLEQADHSFLLNMRLSSKTPHNCSAAVVIMIAANTVTGQVGCYAYVLYMCVDRPSCNDRL